MSILRRWRSRLMHLFRGARSRQELEEEMTFHVDRLTDDLIRRGMDPREARRQARIRFGNREWVQERVRQERGLALLDETARNLKMGLRGMLRRPLFTATFVATLGLCVGLAAAVFSVADAALWRPLPYPAPDRLALAVLYDPAFGKSPGRTSVDGRTWERIRDEGEPLGRAVYSGWVRGVNLTTDEAAAFVQQQRVGAGWFRVLGVDPLIGREFHPEEDVPDGPAVAILSHALWTGTFEGDPEVLGGTIRLKGEPHTVVGIMPPDFRPTGVRADVWTPLRPSRTGEGGGTNYAVLVRIPKRMSFAEADARLASIEPPEPTSPEAPERRFGLVPFEEVHTAGLRLPMFILLGAVGVLLLVGCANLAGLQVARALSRRPEMATRQALGGGAATLVRQTVVETAILGLLGGLIGLAVAYLGVAVLEGLARAHFGIWQGVRLDGRAVAVAAGTTALATLLFALVPLAEVTRPGAHRLLVHGARLVGGGGHALRKLLLVGQVAMVTVLLFGAGLLVRSYGHLEGLDPGFDPEGVLAIEFSLDDARYAEPDEVKRLFRESLAEIHRIRGVQAAAVSLTLPYERPLNMGFRLPEAEDWQVTNVVYVTPGFFEVMGIPLLQGRTLLESDRPGAPAVAVANQAFVDANLGDRRPLGSRIEMGYFGEGGGEIVGVVGNVQQSAGWGGVSQPVWETPTLYVPAWQAGGFGIHIWFAPSWVVRAALPPAELAPRLRRVFQEVDPELPVARVATLEDVIDRAFAEQRFEASLLIAVAAFALLLAGIGLYGIVAHEVLERRTEMGLRMALGASPRRAVWAVGAGGVRLTAMGLVVGGVATVAVAKVMRNLIWGVAPYDPAVLASLVAVLALLAAVASFVPAARVGRMDPARILREG